MTPEQAAWVRAAAWRNCHRKGFAEIPATYSMCACQLGQCGHCAAGRHRSCTHENHPAGEHPAGYLTDRGGYVKAQLWEVGHRHVWTCACKKAGHDVGPVQMALF